MKAFSEGNLVKAFITISMGSICTSFRLSWETELHVSDTGEASTHLLFSVWSDRACSVNMIGLHGIFFCKARSSLTKKSLRTFVHVFQETELVESII